MEFIIDSNVLIEIFSGNEETIEKVKKITIYSLERPNITVLNYSELLFGRIKKKDYSKIKNILDSDFTLLTITRNSAEIYSNLKYELEKLGEMIPDFDMLIASIAIDSNKTLITSDRHFSKIKGFKLVMI